MRIATVVSGLMIGVFPCLLAADEPQHDVSFPLTAERLLFLGDSITHAGGYVNHIETQLILQSSEQTPEFFNIGLASETCSGLSEPGHPFPRPNIHGRLDRALAAINPDVVVACYGMNDGIYHPFDEERFRRYQDGIRQLVEKVHQTGAKIVLLTPPPYDAEAVRGKGTLLPAGKDGYGYLGVYEEYDSVLKKYGEWLLEHSGADMVIDMHTPITAAIAERRRKDPEYTIAPDGVHPNEDGHELLARTILNAWGIEQWIEPAEEVSRLMSERGTLLHDAWLTHVGHQRPQTPAGLPLAEAQAKVEALEERLAPLFVEARAKLESK